MHLCQFGSLNKADTVKYIILKHTEQSGLTQLQQTCKHDNLIAVQLHIYTFSNIVFFPLYGHSL